MTALTYENLCDRLIDSAPALRQKYAEELTWWHPDAPRPHVVFGDLLNPYLISLLDEDDEAPLTPIFAFLEVMATDEDIDVRNVLEVTVLEMLRGYEDLWEKAGKFMGEETIRIGARL